MSDIVQYLFETNAIRFCPENKPFWYTSGKIGPYFINTHFIYGSEEMANELLSFIDEEKSKKMTLPKNVFDKVFKQYEENEIYKNVINTMKSFIEKNINVDEIDYVSGGERRDWFFSNMIAYLLKKPHITIYKDLDTVVSNFDFTETTKIESIQDAKVLHVADLVTVASSYIRAWIPAIENLGGKITWSAVVVDRMQGGAQKLEDAGVTALSLVQVNPHLFEKALDLSVINKEQLDMLNRFFENPDYTMRNFLISHPEFLENSLNSDAKSAERAKLCIEQDLYNLKK